MTTAACLPGCGETNDDGSTFHCTTECFTAALDAAPAKDERCARCRNYLRLCGHDLPFSERMRTVGLHHGWARGSH